MANGEFGLCSLFFCLALCHDTKVVELFHKIIFLFFILCNFYSALFLFLLLLFTGNAREKLRKIRLKHFENAPPFEKSTNEDFFPRWRYIATIDAESSDLLANGIYGNTRVSPTFCPVAVQNADTSESKRWRTFGICT